MPGLGRRTFAPGEVLTATNVMGYLQDQAVMNFAGTAARGSAIGTAVSQGMVSYLDDTNSIEVYKTYGTAVAGWEPVNLAQSPNFIINGAFDINQRSFTSTTTSNTYGFDRWKFYAAGGTVTYSAQTFSLGAAPSSSFEGRNFARIVTTGQSGVNDEASIYQPIESVRTLAGQTVTVSFWAKAASGTPKVAIEMTQYFGSGGSPSNISRTYFGQVTLSTSWNRYFVTGVLPSISGKTLGTSNDDNMTVNLFVSAGSNLNSRTGSLGVQNNTFDFWGVQVEQGQTATPFRRNADSIQGELAACQRYYWRWTQEINLQSTAIGYLWGAGEMLFHFNTPVQLRATPTTVGYSAPSATYFLGNGTNYTGATNPVSVWGSRNHVSFLFTGTGAATNQVAHVRPPLNTIFFADAEL